MITGFTLECFKRRWSVWWAADTVKYP